MLSAKGAILLAGAFLSAGNLPHPTAHVQAEQKPVSVASVAPTALRPANHGVTQAYGHKDPALYGNGAHDGEDLKNDCGADVESPVTGRVTDVVHNNPTYGDFVKITGYDGAVHLLGHTEPAVNVSDSIRKGQVIGHTNKSGHSTGCHTHWSVIQGGKIIDPEVWLAQPEVCPHLYGVPAEWGVEICLASTKYQADPSTVAAIIWYENRGWPAQNKYVCSGAGACGIAQFIHQTWEKYRVDGSGDGQTDITNWRDSVHSAAHYIGSMHKTLRDTLITYNNTWANVGKPDSALPAETVDYIRGATAKYNEFYR